MIVYVRFGVFVRGMLCTAVITIAITVALVGPNQPAPAPPTNPETSVER